MSMQDSGTDLLEAVVNELKEVGRKVFRDDTIPLTRKRERIALLAELAQPNHEMLVKGTFHNLYAYFGSEDFSCFQEQGLFGYFPQAKEPFHNLSVILDAARFAAFKNLAEYIVGIACEWRGVLTPSNSVKDRAMKQFIKMLLERNKYALMDAAYGAEFNSLLEGVSHE